MMFLEFFIWGGWFVTLGTYLSTTLGASGIQTGNAYATQSIGAIVAPFIIGLIADRFFSAQKILGFLHLCGAALMYFASQAKDFAAIYPLLLIYMILYMPTLALVNSISFRQMTDPSKQFSNIRVLGTIGWIVAGILIGQLNWEADGLLKNTFYMTAGASALLGLFSFTLPDTPPAKSKNEKVKTTELLGLDSLKMLNNKNYLLFFIASILICIPLAFYYNFTNQFMNEIGVEKAASKMALGQASEVIFMLLLPFFYLRLGLKKTILLGMASWALRYVLFAYGNADSNVWMIYIGILLHGICYDFFFVTGQIYTDAKAGEKFKSAAQGLITLATYGVGMLIGAQISGVVVDKFITEGSHDWRQIWMYPAVFALVVLILFTVFFKNEKVAYKHN